MISLAGMLLLGIRETLKISEVNDDLGSVGRDKASSCPLRVIPHQSQLPEEQSSLKNGDAKQQASEPRKPIRIIRDPLRFERQFFVDYRFFFALTLGFVGLLFGVWGGEYFYRERGLVGAALVGCGWLCGWIAWGLIL
jgi:hypothetical protein